MALQCQSGEADASRSTGSSGDAVIHVVQTTSFILISFALHVGASRPFASSDWMDIKPFAASDGCPPIAFDNVLKKCADKNVLKKIRSRTRRCDVYRVQVLATPLQKLARSVKILTDQQACVSAA